MEVFVEVAVAAGAVVGVKVYVEVAAGAPPVAVFVGVTVTVPVVAPVLITTVSKVPNGWELAFDNLHVPVMLPAVAGAMRATETSADSPGFTIFPMAVAFPPIISP